MTDMVQLIKTKISYLAANMGEMNPNICIEELGGLTVIFLSHVGNTALVFDKIENQTNAPNDNYWTDNGRFIIENNESNLFSVYANAVMLAPYTVFVIDENGHAISGDDNYVYVHEILSKLLVNKKASFVSQQIRGNFTQNE